MHVSNVGKALVRLNSKLANQISQRKIQSHSNCSISIWFPPPRKANIKDRPPLLLFFRNQTLYKKKATGSSEQQTKGAQANWLSPTLECPRFNSLIFRGLRIHGQREKSKQNAATFASARVSLFFLLPVLPSFRSLAPRKWRGIKD